MVTKNKPKLPKGDAKTPVHPHLLNIPLDLYERMITKAGLKWRKVTPFIVEAITEKLDRMKQEKTE
jgi:hypothetical protein